MANPQDFIPEQIEGQETNAIHIVDKPTLQEAHNLFLLVKDRIRNVSRWHEYAGPHSARFGITDTQGNDVYKMAEKGDVFYINLPAPGPLAGDGKEWVRIETMEIVEDAEAENEYIAFTARPIGNPSHDNDTAIAHFFSHTSTNTFIIERYQNHVSAAVCGRNETPNNKQTNIYDTVRNTIVALAAKQGLSLPQWNSLVKGIIEVE